MKGWPLLRAFVTLLVLLLAGLPLRSLTREKVSRVAVVSPVSTTEKMTIELTFTQPPENFSLKFLGQDVLVGGEDPSFEAGTTFDAHFPKEGIDLVIEGKWADRFQKVGVSIKVTRADGSEQTQTVWGKRDIFEILTFTGEKQP